MGISIEAQSFSISYLYMRVFFKKCFFRIFVDDDSRVILSEIDGEEGSDYINANHIDVSSSCDNVLRICIGRSYVQVVVVMCMHVL